MRGFLMRKIAGICLIFCLYLTSMSQNTAHRYGYAREDPLIKAFKAVIFYGRQSDWSMVIAELNSINDRIVDIHKIFNVDFKPGINHAIQQKHFQTLANQMANLVFSTIREKYEFAIINGLE